MSNDLSVGLLTVVGVLGGLASLLVLLSALDPTNVVRHAHTHRHPEIGETPASMSCRGFGVFRTEVLPTPQFYPARDGRHKPPGG